MASDPSAAPSAAAKEVALNAAQAAASGNALPAAPVKWFEIQENTFRRWVNDELKKRGLSVTDMKNDWKDGVLLVNLMEIISGQSLGKWNRHPKIITQKMENLSIAIDFIKKEGIKLVNVGAEDIQSGNIRIILGLVWTLILRYEIKGVGMEENASLDDLLKWVQSKIPSYNIKGWTFKDWGDGRAVCALCDAVRPGTFPDHAALTPANALDNARRGIATAVTIGVDELIHADELTHPKVDSRAIITYIAQFRHLPEYHDARNLRAYGPGLFEGIVERIAPFTVEKPPHYEGKLDIHGKGPDGDLAITVNQTGPGKFECSYMPKSPGEYSISILWNNDHILGSTFHANVLASESLGGEGKIRVFFSTTSASLKQRESFRNLQHMLEVRKVHLRPDFESWHPVDLLEKEDREAVFRKAGTRNLPIVFIDDKYVGDYDKMVELNENGELDRLLQMEKFEGRLLTPEEHAARLKSMPWSL